MLDHIIIVSTVRLLNVGLVGDQQPQGGLHHHRQYSPPPQWIQCLKASATFRMATIRKSFVLSVTYCHLHNRLEAGN